MESLPIVLPSVPAPSRRAPLPFIAALVPIAAGVVLWLVSGSILALCFAALGPLMILASLADSVRNRRRERRQDDAQAERDWVAAEAELARRHAEERDALWFRRPDAAACLAQPPLRGVLPPEPTSHVVVGAGSAVSEIHCIGGDDERGRRFRERCRVIEGAPVVVPLGGGICLRGPRPLRDAAARALVLQLCLRFGAAQLSVVGADLDDHGLGALPHAVRARRGGFRLGVGAANGSRIDAAAVIWRTEEDAEVPEGITTVIDIIEPGRATLRTPQGVSGVSVELLSFAQAEAIARSLAQRGEEDDALPDVVSLQELTQPQAADGLAVAIGRGERGDVVVDIVGDGPHAIVTGTTGTGKSELLVSWVTAMAAGNGPERVTFVLADFKGGTAFEPLRELRQVAAVITDLDEGGARRGVSSLTAELRRREGVLAAAGARDVREVAMPRLVIVVDEFAALLAEHPDLGAVFTDVAARGRALGMHLILGTQRAAGIVRDALAANCPLRISLRVGDAADSRLMVGTDAASTLPGGPSSRGLGIVRRPADDEPVPMRIALTGAADLRRVALRWASEPPPRSPWLPALPARIALADLVAESAAGSDAIVLGLADDPEHQSQPLELLRGGRGRGLVVLGASGSGRSAVLRAVAAQRPDALWIPADPEEAWDLVAAWSTGGERPPAVVLCDDFDALLATLPPEHAQQYAHFWEQVVRAGSSTTFVLAAARASGAPGRVFDLVAHRALLRMPTRVEHMAAGGEAAGFVRDRVPGRARIGDREVQFAWVEEEAVRPPHRTAAAWVPSSDVTAVVSAGAAAVAARLRRAHPECEVIDAGIEPSSGRACIVVADAETWQRNWSSWQRIRATGEVLIRAEQQADLRQLAAVRELPPYARPHAGRAWSVVGAGSPRRVVLPELSP
ncbi:FtsK/SpoIIIE domain-containing protein [Microbacterium sp. MYb62]|uniref:FtsK/SpoIIIE domain-containing protein n=1 Tax=Microbacterium sp. MYb62 TaxID=1848690 RepID=UPI000CFD9A12|nr:FtsK/SpoIIIE domain-containing protein [Microbacterium sp. MYb62]PRB19149.1 cell division protein FtsK [Microbacterium sp. MYb62]